MITTAKLANKSAKLALHLPDHLKMTDIDRNSHLVNTRPSLHSKTTVCLAYPASGARNRP